MPVSHIGLTVSHLPTSCSFFLAALQPLGYRYIGEQANQIGLGITDADFFLCQETPGMKAGAAHIAFTAPSRAAVRNFYAAALNAGGRPNGAPACRTEDSEHFNAAVLDYDGNSIEVVFQNEPNPRGDGTVTEQSRVLKWQKSVAESYRDDRSVASARTSQTAPRQTAAAPSAAPPQAGIHPIAAQALAQVHPSAPSVASMAATMIRSVSTPSAPQATGTSTSNGEGTAKTIIGTLLGAAAGAAVAYAMAKGEQDSARKEAEFAADKEAQAPTQARAYAVEQPRMIPMQAAPQQICEAPRSVYRDYPDTASQYSAAREGSVYMQRAIGAPPPRSTYSLSDSPTAYPSYAPSHVERQPMEYVPAASVAPSRTQFAAQRSMTSPELSTVSRAKSTVSKAPSAAPSSFISSFVADQPERRNSEGSVYSSHSSKSKAKSAYSSASKHNRTPSPPESSTKAPSAVGSALGRDFKPVDGDDDDEFNEDFNFDWKDDDNETVAPDDSISNVGSGRRRRSHRSHKSSSRSSAGSEVSRHSSSSKHSSRSKHSHHSPSKRSHHGTSSPLSQEWEAAKNNDARSRVMSETSDASTVRPTKPSSSRKDSMMSDQYDSFNGKVKYGNGSVAAMPIRGITPSEIGERSEPKESKRDRSVVGGEIPIRGFTPSMVGEKTESRKESRKDRSVVGGEIPIRGFTPSMVGEKTESRKESKKDRSVVGGGIPIRGFTPSMVGEKTEPKKEKTHKSMINYALGLKMRAFES